MESIRNGSFRLFRLAGIDVYLHWSWFLIALIEVQFRSKYYDSVLWNAAEYLCLFVIVLMHEFGHALACRSVGGVARHIVLWPLGGVAFVQPPPRPGAVRWSIAAGPLVNLLLVPVTVALCLGCGVPMFEPQAQITPAQHFLWWLWAMNLGLFVFNMLPIYPLDGGQVVWALLWFALGRWRSLQIVSVIGMVCGGLAVLLCLLSGELWLAVLAVFVGFRSAAGFFQSREALHLESLPRHREVNCPRCSSHPPKGPFWVCDHCQTRFDTFQSRGVCPGCGAWFHETACPDCRRTSHIEDWLGSDLASRER
jgi:Zn-dependent protease